MLTITILLLALSLVCQPPVCLPELQQDKQYLPFVASSTPRLGEAPTIPTEGN